MESVELGDDYWLELAEVALRAVPCWCRTDRADLAQAGMLTLLEWQSEDRVIRDPRRALCTIVYRLAVDDARYHERAIPEQLSDAGAVVSECRCRDEILAGRDFLLSENVHSCLTSTQSTYVLIVVGGESSQKNVARVLGATAYEVRRLRKDVATRIKNRLGSNRDSLFPPND